MKNEGLAANTEKNCTLNFDRKTWGKLDHRENPD
jgi:hypothetical protein